MMQTCVTALGAVFLCLIFAGSAATECVTPPRVAAFIKANNPDAERVAILSGPKLAWFLERWNAIPPITNLSADLIWIYDARMKATVFIGLFNNGCLLAADEQPKSLFRRIFPEVELLEGQDA